MKKICLFLIFSAATLMVFGKSDTLLTINSKPILSQEFEYYFNKNNNEAFQDKLSKEDYLDLFINFKLKVAEAYRLQMDTTQSFIQELAGYRNQLIKPYLTDNVKIKELVKEAYQHLLEDVDVSHILIRLTPNPTPEDTLKAYQKAINALAKLNQGIAFEKVALEFSEDPTVKENSGRLGFITGMMVVYPFEKAAYSTPVGKYTSPIRTRFGYHIIKVHDRRESPGERLLAHILKRVPEDATERQIKNIEQSLQAFLFEVEKGADFHKLAQANSDDQSSARNGGRLSWIGTGKTTPEFEKAAFELEKIGDISQPVRTEFGFHIIKLLDKRDIMSFEEASPLLEPRVKSDERASIIMNSFIDKLKEEYQLKEFPDNMKATHLLVALPKTNIIEIAKTHTKPIYTFANQTITQYDLVEYLHANEQTDNPISLELLKKYASQLLTIKLIDYENNNLENKYPEFGLLMNEYKDGILLFNISNEKVWSKASKDIDGISAFFNSNREKYSWDRPRFKGSIVYCDSKETYKKAKKLAKKTPTEDIASTLRRTFNNSEKTAIMIENGLFAEGTNPTVDKLVFKKGKLPKNEQYPYVFVNGKIQKKYPDSFMDVRGIVTNDYQNYLDKEWIKQLRSSYNIIINQDALQRIQTNE